MQSVQLKTSNKMKHWHKINPINIKEVPQELRKLVEILCSKFGQTVNYVWEELVIPALDQLDEDLEAGDIPADYDSDFMYDHFGIEPDLFINMLEFVS